jgi:hypothetical protein
VHEREEGEQSRGQGLELGASPGSQVMAVGFGDQQIGGNGVVDGREGGGSVGELQSSCAALAAAMSYAVPSVAWGLARGEVQADKEELGGR